MSEPPLVFKRMLVAMNGSPGAALAAEVAAALAARHRARLHGLFVEDINLVHLAGLRVGRLVRTTGKGGAFDEGAMRAHFTLERTRSRRALEAASTRQGVLASFTVSRGRVDAEVVSASREADLVVIALTERPRPGHVGSTALALAESCAVSVLLLRSAASVGASILLLLDAPEAPGKALGMALGLASGSEAAITIVPTDPTVDPARWEALLRSLADAPVTCRLAPLEGDLSAAALCAKATEIGADAVVMSADNPSVHGEQRRALLENLGCPVLLVR